MMNKFQNLVQRSVSGLVFVAVIVCSVLWSPIAFGVVFFTVSVLGLSEFHTLTAGAPCGRSPFWPGVLGGGLLFLSGFLDAGGFVSSFPVYSVYGLFVLSVFIAELFRRGHHPVEHWAYFFLGQAYVALPFALLNYLIFLHGFQPWLVLALFITLWVNDTGAYVSGMLLGRRKLCERISPKKTWEGFVGGALFALVSGYVFSRFITDISALQWAGFSLLVVVFGTLGDLCESLLKRTENVKDAGKIIPGHGGILDRFDSMLLAAPVALGYWLLILD